MWGLQGEPLQKLLRIIMLCNKNTCKAFYGIYIMLYVKNNCGFKFLIIQTSQNNTKQQQQKITQINWKWFTNFYLSNLTKPTFIISCQNFLTYVSWTVMTKLSIVLYLWLWYLLCTYCSRMYCAIIRINNSVNACYRHPRERFVSICQNCCNQDTHSLQVNPPLYSSLVL